MRDGDLVMAQLNFINFLNKTQLVYPCKFIIFPLMLYQKEYIQMYL